MKQLARLVLLSALGLPLPSGCGLPAPAGPVTFDLLARRVPADVEQAFFLDLKPGGDAGTYWERIRSRLVANSQARPVLDSLLSQFRVKDFGLDAFLVGPAASGYLNDVPYSIVQVNSPSAARDAILLQDPRNLDWVHEDYGGETLYHGHNRWSNGQREWLALTIYDQLLILAWSYTRDPVDDLKAFVSLSEQDSLASLPAWGTLRARLADDPMGLVFLNLGNQLRQNPPPANDTSLTAFGQQIEALALAAVPEKNGMRVEIAGSVVLQGNVPAAIRSLLELPGVDPASWAGLPADTAIAISTHGAPTVWPLLRDAFSLQALGAVRDTVGLDIESDLFGVDGPFSSDLAMAITPPLPGQPISQGLAAGQLLFLARGTSQAQMAAVQAAMESQGAVLGSQTVNGIALQVQAGTAPAGYAISFGFDEDVFLLGTSPGIVGQSVSARRDGGGLVQSPAFRAVLGTMPQDPSFFFYLNRPSLTDMAQANMTEHQYGQSQELLGLEAFDAIGLGLKLHTDRIDGTLYFFMREG
jgi:hypothetical protein